MVENSCLYALYTVFRFKNIGKVVKLYYFYTIFRDKINSGISKRSAVREVYKSCFKVRSNSIFPVILICYVFLPRSFFVQGLGSVVAEIQKKQ